MHLLRQAAIGLLTRRFEIVQTRIDLAQRGFQRRHQAGDRIVLARQFASSLCLDFFKCGGGHREKGVRTVLQAFNRQRLKTLPEFSSGPVEKGDLFRGDVFFVLQRGFQSGHRRQHISVLVLSCGDLFMACCQLFLKPGDASTCQPPSPHDPGG